MNESQESADRQKPQLSLLRVGIAVMVFLLFMYILTPPHSRRTLELANRAMCMANLTGLGKALTSYANETAIPAYPTPEKWCDLLIRHYGTEKTNFVPRKQFLCIAASRQGDQGPCHYAINPNCDPSSPDDTVLLFESKGGWNRFGGLEIVTTQKPRRRRLHYIV